VGIIPASLYARGEGALMTSAAATITTPAATSSVRKTLLLQTIVALILSLAIGLYFWVDSRYPSLLKKLHSGQSIKR
jgi:hypothetical protein